MMCQKYAKLYWLNKIARASFLKVFCKNFKFYWLNMVVSQNPRYYTTPIVLCLFSRIPHVVKSGIAIHKLSWKCYKFI